MILKFSMLIMLLLVYVSGQNCTLRSGKSGYCREQDDCFGPLEENSCQKQLICCQNTMKSYTKCRYYGKYVYKQVYNSALTVRASIHKVSQCSIVEVPLVVGGVKAQKKEFPHMVAIGYGEDIQYASWLCGGSLISENFVLSAAHCRESWRGPAKFARMGVLNVVAPDNAGLQDFILVKKIVHPKYKPPSRYNDIALFKLSDSVKINSFVRPACLHTNSDEFSFKKPIATGWGKVDFNANKVSEHLLKVSLDLIDHSKCNHSFKTDRYLKKGVSSSQICAGVMEGGKDTCQGDSGGPLQIVLDNPYCMYSILGITSFGKFCGFKNSPSIYTRVSHFVPWIESIVWD